MIKHGGSKTRAYGSWDAMTQRCTNPKHKAFHRYGGRGIVICDRWRDFANFLADMGQPPSDKHSLERENNDLGYSLDNCKWATKIEQQNNMARNRRLTLNDKTLTVAQWARVLGVRPQLIDQRLRRGWSLERTLTGIVRKHENDRRFLFNGKELTLSQLSEESKITYKLLHKRIIVKGWSVGRATCPVSATKQAVPV